MSNLATIPAPDDKPVPTSGKLPKYAQDANRPYEGDPWSKQAGESHKSYECFTIYLKLEGERNITEAGRIYCEKYGLTHSNVARQWGTRHRWVERAEAYDSFITAKEVRALSKRRVRAAIKHADQAEAAQEIVMLPIAELRKRITAQGGELAAIAELDEVSLIKLYKALGGGAELAGLQKAERDAIGAGTEGGTGMDVKVIAERGAVLKRVLGNPELVAMFERVTIEGTQETPDEAVDG